MSTNQSRQVKPKETVIGGGAATSTEVEMGPDINGHFGHMEQQEKLTVVEQALCRSNSTNLGRNKVLIEEIKDSEGKGRSRQLKNHLEPRSTYTKMETKKERCRPKSF